ncbi:hypothetical protein B0E33_13710 [Roseibium algicola]|jgi:CRP-like cAMP-binding protein|uniref:Cyclic nucleotide-binding domain-containing protein n=1 Tax=Roseibium algicola TaxID=2857014 RepID=A0ABN4WS07_9HYPH|nr:MULTISPECIES: cyclic nucleotide-binding domain-containing protein [Stappiaceae]MEC9403783.1 cyclic nucleotide-binding domain-containing protein [Pseudomonadota bacterium]AQQ04504.1 hypothetical protein B0E33_13710 [Roseibium aggregatum]MBO6858828.1 cyclic nucleotide-binding domain-containing protein [Roseibium sp.]MBO9461819.1 cyclic nucleotide-binding domain-containing protein [Labrenzia sp. R5_0]MEC9472926.1 cyclic nucleotide-binding domain-containing protein [Pseudomonadota bacterium]
MRTASIPVEEKVQETEDLETIFHRMTEFMPQRVADAVRAASRRVPVAAHQDVIVEGETSDGLYIVLEGTFGIYRKGDGTASDHRVAEIGPGQPFGEMALLDGEPRSATVRAETAGAVLEIEPERILELADGEARLAEFKGALASFVTRRMRASTQEHVAALQRELDLRNEQQQFGKFFVYSLIMMSIGTLVNNVLARTIVNVDVYTEVFAWQYLAILMVPSLFVIRHMGISISALGLTTVGLKKSLIEGAIISVGLCIFAWGLAAVLKYFDALPGKPLPFNLLGTLSYFLHSALQEIIARGFLQSSFQRFLGDQGKWRSVLLASVLFGMFHLHFGIPAVLMTIGTGFIFGWIYIRHQNIAGVILIHYMMGVAAFNTGLI